MPFMDAAANLRRTPLVPIDDRQRPHDVVRPRVHTSFNTLSIYVCRTRISCVFPQQGQSTLIFFDHAAPIRAQICY